MVEVNNLTMRFSHQLLFENINLKLDRGKRYGLIGANGAGKTTFWKILAGELEQTSGNISIENGLRVGVLSQNQYAFEEYTLKDAVMYGNKRLLMLLKKKSIFMKMVIFRWQGQWPFGGTWDHMCRRRSTYEVDVMIEKILATLGFPVDTHTNLYSWNY